jgi:hypothetical protein
MVKMKCAMGGKNEVRARECVLVNGESAVAETEAKQRKRDGMSVFRLILHLVVCSPCL